MATNNTAIPTYPPFDCHGENVSVRWTKWINRLTKNVFVAYNITDATHQKALVLTLGGDELNDIVDSFTETQLAGNEHNDVLQKLVKTLNEHFNPKQNLEYQRYVFRQTKQLEGETAEKFRTRLSQLADTCDFHDKDVEIKSQLILGAACEKVTRKGLAEPKITLDQLTEYAKTLEITSSQQKDIRQTPQMPQTNVNTVQYKTKAKAQSGAARPQKQRRARSRSPTPTCFNCGKTWPHKGDQRNCPARNFNCEACYKQGHYTKLCRSTGEKGSDKHELWHKKRSVRNVNTESSDSEQENSDIEYAHALNNGDAKLPLVTVHINGRQVKMLIDTGASVNIIDETTWRSQFMGPKLLPLNKAHITLVPYGSKQKIQVMGKCEVKIEHGANKIHSTIYIVKGKYGCLLGYKSATDLSLISMVQRVDTTPLEDTIHHKFPKLFSGIGKLKGVKVKLHIDPAVQPTAISHRRVPFHLRAKVEAKLKELEEQDIIERVEGPTPWVSTIVTPPKPNDPSDIRLCVDMRGPNRAIQRERHVTPTIEEVLADLNGAKLFSRLDLNNGYHQLLLDESSRYITTFSSHIGLWRYKRLNFGISCASEIFQNTIRITLQGLEGVLNVSDDILVYAGNQDQHEKRLRAVLERLQQRGLTLNGKKCQFAQTSLTYLGYRFNSDGVSVDPSKVEDISRATAPTNPTQVRSFLGLANYCARFVPQFATISAPLRQLTKKGIQWSWNAEHQEAFEEIKRILSSERVMTYFDPMKNTEVLVDASPVGVAAILTQKSKNGRVHTVSYASRALTEVEKRYSQTEREALAVVFGCEKFHLYLFGQPFTILTDHRPLIPMFNNAKAKLPARIERWVLRLQQYDMQVSCRPGHDNPADFTSRHPAETTRVSRGEKVAEEYINFVAAEAVPIALDLQVIKQHTMDDAQLQAVIQALQSNRWPKNLTAFLKIKHELAVTADQSIVMRGTRIVLPQALQDQAVQIAHEGHLGIVKTKQLLRSKVWFPGIDKRVQQLMDHCIACQANTAKQERAPIQMTALPDGPWKNLAADFYGPLPSGEHLLVIIDEYSRYPIVEPVSRLTAEAIIPVFDRIMAMFGIPQGLKTDNGPPFNSSAFKHFASTLGFKHHRVTPYWPEANGEAERFMKTLGKALRSAVTSGTPWKQGLTKFLRNYRNAPHSTTCIAPAASLFGRELANKLPNLADLEDIGEHDRQGKAKIKAYAEKKRRVRETELEVGDTVLVRQERKNKLSSHYDPKPYTVTDVKESQVTAEQHKGRSVTRNSSFFKKVPKGVTEGQKLDIDSDSDDDIDITALVPNPTVAQQGTPAAVPAPAPQRPSQQNIDVPEAAIQPHPPDTQVPRSSGRPRQQPKHFNDFVLK